MNTLSIIYVVWLRQVKRYFRSRPRIFGSLGQPLLFLLALGFGMGPIYERAGQGNYLQFLGPGIIAMGIIFMAIFSGIEIIWDRQFGFLKEMLVAPVGRNTIMLGRTLGGATVATFQGIVVLIVASLVGFHPVFSVGGMLLAFIFMFMSALVFTSLGTAIASKLTDMQAFPLIMNFLVMPVFFLSGAIFPLQGLPNWVNRITIFNPLVYGVDGLRHSLTAIAGSPATDFVALFIFSATFVAIGGWFFSQVEI